MRRAAIFGGSFSPFHEGHRNLVREVLRRGLADEVWIMPCRRNPLKDGSTTWDDRTRLEMLRREAREIDPERVRVSDMELGMPEPSYTCDTARRLMAEHPDVRFRLLVGADSYLRFEEWRDWRWLEEQLCPIVYPRPGYGIEHLREGWTLLDDAPQTDISSTRIRNEMKTKS